MRDDACERVLLDVLLHDAVTRELSAARQVAARLALPEPLVQRCLARLTQERRLWIFQPRAPLYAVLYGAPGLP